MQRLKTSYLKTRVLKIASELPFIMADMTQQPFEVYSKTENLKDPFAFEHALFLAQAARKWKIDASAFTPVERHFYDKSIEQLNKFYELHLFMRQVEELNINVFYLYWKLTTDQAASNMTSYDRETGDVNTQQMSDTIAAYNALEASLDPHPEWQAKLREELGKYINIIYSLHIENPQMEKILGSFDRHLYFK